MADPKDSEEAALSRWARLKSESRTAVAPAPEAGHPMTDGSAGADEEQSPAEVEPVRIEDLPDVETLTYESDFTVFMREGVPEELRRLALRRLWRSNPILANLDGLNDYDLDYNKIGADGRVTEAILAQRRLKDEALLERTQGRRTVSARRPRQDEADDVAPRSVETDEAAPRSDKTGAPRPEPEDKA